MTYFNKVSRVGRHLLWISTDNTRNAQEEKNITTPYLLPRAQILPPINTFQNNWTFQSLSNAIQNQIFRHLSLGQDLIAFNDTKIDITCFIKKVSVVNNNIQTTVSLKPNNIHQLTPLHLIQNLDENYFLQLPHHDLAELRTFHKIPTHKQNILDDRFANEFNALSPHEKKLVEIVAKHPAILKLLQSLITEEIDYKSPAINESEPSLLSQNNIPPHFRIAKQDKSPTPPPIIIQCDFMLKNSEDPPHKLTISPVKCFQKPISKKMKHRLPEIPKDEKLRGLTANSRSKNLLKRLRDIITKSAEKFKTQTTLITIESTLDTKFQSSPTPSQHLVSTTPSINALFLSTTPVQKLAKYHSDHIQDFSNIVPFHPLHHLLAKPIHPLAPPIHIGKPPHPHTPPPALQQPLHIGGSPHPHPPPPALQQPPHIGEPPHPPPVLHQLTKISDKAVSLKTKLLPPHILFIRNLTQYLKLPYHYVIPPRLPFVHVDILDPIKNKETFEMHHKHKLLHPPKHLQHKLVLPHILKSNRLFSTISQLQLTRFSIESSSATPTVNTTLYSAATTSESKTDSPTLVAYSSAASKHKLGLKHPIPKKLPSPKLVNPLLLPKRMLMKHFYKALFKNKSYDMISHLAKPHVHHTYGEPPPPPHLQLLGHSLRLLNKNSHPAIRFIGTANCNKTSLQLSDYSLWFSLVKNAQLHSKISFRRPLKLVPPSKPTVRKKYVSPTSPSDLVTDTPKDVPQDVYDGSETKGFQNVSTLPSTSKSSTPHFAKLRTKLLLPANPPKTKYLLHEAHKLSKAELDHFARPPVPSHLHSLIDLWPHMHNISSSIMKLILLGYHLNKPIHPFAPHAAKSVPHFLRPPVALKRHKIISALPRLVKGFYYKPLVLPYHDTLTIKKHHAVPPKHKIPPPPLLAIRPDIVTKETLYIPPTTGVGDKTQLKTSIRPTESHTPTVKTRATSYSSKVTAKSKLLHKPRKVHNISAKTKKLDLHLRHPISIKQLPMKSILSNQLLYFRPRPPIHFHHKQLKNQSYNNFGNSENSRMLLHYTHGKPSPPPSYPHHPSFVASIYPLLMHNNPDQSFPRFTNDWASNKTSISLEGHPPWPDPSKHLQSNHKINFPPPIKRLLAIKPPPPHKRVSHSTLSTAAVVEASTIRTDLVDTGNATEEVIQKVSKLEFQHRIRSWKSAKAKTKKIPLSLVSPPLKKSHKPLWLPGIAVSYSVPPPSLLLKILRTGNDNASLDIIQPYKHLFRATPWFDYRPHAGQLFPPSPPKFLKLKNLTNRGLDVLFSKTTLPPPPRHAGKFFITNLTYYSKQPKYNLIHQLSQSLFGHKFELSLDKNKTHLPELLKRKHSLPRLKIPHKSKLVPTLTPHRIPAILPHRLQPKTSHFPIKTDKSSGPYYSMLPSVITTTKSLLVQNTSDILNITFMLVTKLIPTSKHTIKRPPVPLIMKRKLPFPSPPRPIEFYHMLRRSHFYEIAGHLEKKSSPLRSADGKPLPPPHYHHHPLQLYGTMEYPSSDIGRKWVSNNTLLGKSSYSHLLQELKHAQPHRKVLPSKIKHLPKPSLATIPTHSIEVLTNQTETTFIGSPSEKIIRNATTLSLVPKTAPHSLYTPTLDFPILFPAKPTKKKVHLHLAFKSPTIEFKFSKHPPVPPTPHSPSFFPKHNSSWNILHTMRLHPHVVETSHPIFPHIAKMLANFSHHQNVDAPAAITVTKRFPQYFLFPNNFTKYTRLPGDDNLKNYLQLPYDHLLDLFPHRHRIPSNVHYKYKPKPGHLRLKPMHRLPPVATATSLSFVLTPATMLLSRRPDESDTSDKTTPYSVMTTSDFKFKLIQKPKKDKSIVPKPKPYATHTNEHSLLPLKLARLPFFKPPQPIHFYGMLQSNQSYDILGHLEKPHLPFCYGDGKPLILPHLHKESRKPSNYPLLLCKIINRPFNATLIPKPVYRNWLDMLKHAWSHTTPIRLKATLLPFDKLPARKTHLLKTTLSPHVIDGDTNATKGLDASDAKILVRNVSVLQSVSPAPLHRSTTIVEGVSKKPVLPTKLFPAKPTIAGLKILKGPPELPAPHPMLFLRNRQHNFSSDIIHPFQTHRHVSKPAHAILPRFHITKTPPIPHRRYILFPNNVTAYLKVPGDIIESHLPLWNDYASNMLPLKHASVTESQYLRKKPKHPVLPHFLPFLPHMLEKQMQLVKPIAPINAKASKIPTRKTPSTSSLDVVTMSEPESVVNKKKNQSTTYESETYLTKPTEHKLEWKLPPSIHRPPLRAKLSKLFPFSVPRLPERFFHLLSGNQSYDIVGLSKTKHLPMRHIDGKPPHLHPQQLPAINLSLKWVSNDTLLQKSAFPHLRHMLKHITHAHPQVLPPKMRHLPPRPLPTHIIDGVTNQTAYSGLDEEKRIRNVSTSPTVSLTSVFSYSSTVITEDRRKKPVPLAKTKPTIAGFKVLGRRPVPPFPHQMTFFRDRQHNFSSDIIHPIQIHRHAFKPAHPLFPHFHAAKLPPKPHFYYKSFPGNLTGYLKLPSDNIRSYLEMWNDYTSNVLAYRNRTAPEMHHTYKQMLQHLHKKPKHPVLPHLLPSLPHHFQEKVHLAKPIMPVRAKPRKIPTKKMPSTSPYDVVTLSEPESVDKLKENQSIAYTPKMYSNKPAKPKMGMKLPPFIQQPRLPQKLSRLPTLSEPRLPERFFNLLKENQSYDMIYHLLKPDFSMRHIDGKPPPPPHLHQPLTNPLQIHLNHPAFSFTGKGVSNNTAQQKSAYPHLRHMLKHITRAHPQVLPPKMRPLPPRSLPTHIIDGVTNQTAYSGLDEEKRIRNVSTLPTVSLTSVFSYSSTVITEDRRKKPVPLAKTKPTIAGFKVLGRRPVPLFPHLMTFFRDRQHNFSSDIIHPIQIHRHAFKPAHPLFPHFHAAKLPPKPHFYYKSFPGNLTGYLKLPSDNIRSYLEMWNDYTSNVLAYRNRTAPEMHHTYKQMLQHLHKKPKHPVLTHLFPSLPHHFQKQMHHVKPITRASAKPRKIPTKKTPSTSPYDVVTLSEPESVNKLKENQSTAYTPETYSTKPATPEVYLRLPLSIQQPRLPLRLSRLSPLSGPRFPKRFFHLLSGNQSYNTIYHLLKPDFSMRHTDGKPPPPQPHIRHKSFIAAAYPPLFWPSTANAVFNITLSQKSTFLHPLDVLKHDQSHRKVLLHHPKKTLLLPKSPPPGKTLLHATSSRFLTDTVTTQTKASYTEPKTMETIQNVLQLVSKPTSTVITMKTRKKLLPKPPILKKKFPTSASPFAKPSLLIHPTIPPAPHPMTLHQLQNYNSSLVNGSNHLHGQLANPIHRIAPRIHIAKMPHYHLQLAAAFQKFASTKLLPHYLPFFANLTGYSKLKSDDIIRSYLQWRQEHNFGSFPYPIQHHERKHAHRHPQVHSRHHVLPHRFLVSFPHALISTTSTPSDQPSISYSTMTMTNSEFKIAHNFTEAQSTTYMPTKLTKQKPGLKHLGLIKQPLLPPSLLHPLRLLKHFYHMAFDKQSVNIMGHQKIPDWSLHFENHRLPPPPLSPHHPQKPLIVSAHRLLFHKGTGYPADRSDGRWTLNITLHKMPPHPHVIDLLKHSQMRHKYDQKKKLPLAHKLPRKKLISSTSGLMKLTFKSSQPYVVLSTKSSEGNQTTPTKEWIATTSPQRTASKNMSITEILTQKNCVELLQNLAVLTSTNVLKPFQHYQVFRRLVRIIQNSKNDSSTSSMPSLLFPFKRIGINASSTKALTDHLAAPLFHPHPQPILPHILDLLCKDFSKKVSPIQGYQKACFMNLPNLCLIFPIIRN